MNEAILVLGRAGVRGGIALIVVYAVCRVLHRLSPDLRCWLWRAAYVKCLAGLFVAVSVAVPILPRAAPERLAAVSPQEPDRESALLTDFEKGETLARASVEPVAEEYPSAPSEAAFADAPAVPVALTDTVPSPVGTRPSWQFYLLLLYALGVSVGAIRLTLAALRTRQLVRRAIPVEHPALPELSRRFGLTATPRLARSSETSSPLLAFGTILLPADATGDESLMIAHELAHLRRRDLAWEWLGIAAQIAFWFHPLVHLARSEERLIREQAADMLTLSRTAAPPAEYARILLEASLRRSGHVPALAVGAVEGGSHLRQRLNALAAPVLTRRRAFALGVVAVMLAAIAFVPWRAVARRETLQDPAVEQKDRMAGVVLDTAGKPVAGVPVSWVTLMRKQTEILATVTTDGAGRFEFDPRLGVRFKIENRSEWYYTGNGWIMARVPGYGLTVERVREPNPMVTLRLAGEQGYSVALRDTKNRPLVGEAVSADSYNDGHSHFPVKWLGYAGKTDANGEYRVTGLPAGKTPWFDWDRSKYALYRYSASGNRTTLTLGPRRSLVGTVFAPDGKPVKEKLTVDVHRTDGPFIPAGQKALWAECDSQGRYRVDGLAAGNYRVGVFRRVGKDLMTTDRRDVSIPATAPVVRADIRLKPISAFGGFRTVDSAGLPSGIVVDVAGKPIPGAEVSWVSPVAGRQKILASVRTDATGRFAFRPAPGVPVMTGANSRALRREHLRDAILVRAKGYGLATSEVGFQKGTHRITMLSPRTYTVTFRDASGKPMVGFPVWVDALNDATPWASVRLKWFGYSGKTDANGLFRATGLPNNERIQWGFDHSRHALLFRTVSGSGTEITLGKGHTLEGTIRMPDGTPAKRKGWLFAEPTGTTPNAARGYADSGANGRYRIIGLTSGTYRISASVDSFEKNRDVIGTNPVEVRIPSTTDTARQDLTFQQAVRLTGRVTDTDGKPMPSLEVSNRNPFPFTKDGEYVGDKTATDSTHTDANGNYVLVLPLGETRVSVQGGDTRSVRIRENGSNRLDFVVARKNLPNIVGRVLDREGRPVAGIGVEIKSDQSAAAPRTDREGFFQWQTRVKDGAPLTVFVRRGGEGAAATIVPGEERTTLTLRLSETGIGYLTGQVTDTQNRPLPKATVQLAMGATYESVGAPYVDAQGRFRIPVFPGAKYRVWFQSPGAGIRRWNAAPTLDGYTEADATRESVSVNAGETKDLGSISLVLGEDTATGLLQDAQGKPVAREILYLRTPSGEWQGTTDSTGRFAIPGVVAGEPCSLEVFPLTFRRDKRWKRHSATVGNMGTITLIQSGR